MRDELPPALCAFTAAAIRLRQTTYWDLELLDPSGPALRVHFVGKIEHHFAAETFCEASLASEHPVLVEYLEPSLRLFVSSASSRPDLVVLQLSHLVQTWSEGWRSLERYRNPDAAPLDVLRSGHGLLMAGPASLVRSAELVLRGLGVETSLIPAANRRRGLRVLLLGHSFVVARHFEFAKPA